MIRFFVEGVPQPKGNHTAFPIVRGACDRCRPGTPCGRRSCVGGKIIGATITDDLGEELKAWEGLIRVSAVSARNRAGERILPKGAACRVSLVFVLTRPGGHYTARGLLSSEGHRHPVPTVRPDFDKLARAACDGLTGALYEDDSQIARADVGKVYAIAHAPAGVLIALEPLIDPLAGFADLLRAGGVQTAQGQGTLL